MNEDNNKYYLLDYTHKELKELLKKLEENMMLTPVQYHQLINEIGLENISTFDSNYYSLINAPNIPTLTSHLGNNSGFIDSDQMNEFMEEDFQPLVERLSAISEELQYFRNLNMDDVVETIIDLELRLGEANEEISMLQNFTVDYKINMENIIDAISNMQEEDESLNKQYDISIRKFENATDLISVNSENINNIVKGLELTNNDLAVLKETAEDLKLKVNNIDGLRQLLENVDLLDRMQKIEEEIEVIGFENFATEDTVVYYYNRVNEIVSDYIMTADNVEKLQEQMKVVSGYIDSIEDNISSHEKSIYEIYKEIETLRASFLGLEEIVTSYLNEDSTSGLEEAVERISTLIQQLENDLAYIELEMGKLSKFDFASEEDLLNMESKYDDLITNLNNRVNAIQEDIDDLPNVNFGDYATQGSLNDLQVKINTDLFQVNTQINIINNKLSKLENLNVDEVATLDYVDNLINNLTNEFRTDILDIEYRVTKNEEALKNCVNIEFIESKKYTTRDYVDSRIVETKEYVNDAIKDVDIDLHGYATENYVDSEIVEVKEYVDSSISNLDMIKHEFITEEEFNKLSKEEQDSEDTLYIVTNSESNTIDISQYATKKYVNDAIKNIDVDSSISNLDIIKHEFVTEEEFNKLPEEEQNSEDTLYIVTDSEGYNIDLSNYATKEYVNGILDNVNVSIEYNENEQELLIINNNEITSNIDLSQYILKSEITDQLEVFMNHISLLEQRINLLEGNNITGDSE